MKQNTLGAFCALALWLACGSAQASGFATGRFTALQGHPMTSNPTALYFNPGALSLGKGKRAQLLVDMNLAMRKVDYERTKTGVEEPAGAEGANLGDASLFSPIFGGIAAGTVHFGDLSIGLGGFIPFGGTAEWDKNEDFEGNQTYPGAYDGVQRWSAIAGTLGAFYGSLGASYDIDLIGLSIGASVNLVRSVAVLTRAQSVAFNDDPSLTTEGRMNLDTAGWDVSMGVGLVQRIGDDFIRIGLSYQAPPGMGNDMELEGTVRTNFNGVVATNDVVLYQRLPDIVRLGVSLKPTQSLELRLFGDYTRWSLFDVQCLSRERRSCELNADGTQKFEDADRPVSVSQRGFQDAFSVRAGLSYWLSEDVELMGGVGWDGNAVPDGMLEPSLYDADDFEIALGGRFGLGEYLALAVSYTHLQYLSRDNTGKGEFDTFEAPSKLPPAEGKFSSWVGIINANVEAAF